MPNAFGRHPFTVLATLLFCLSSALHAQVGSVTSGSWADTATWGAAGIPPVGATVTISSGTTVSVSTAGLPDVGSIIIENSATLLIGAGGALGVGVDAADVLEVWGTLTVQGGGTLTVDSATVHVFGAMNVGGSGTPLDASSAKLVVWYDGVVTQTGGTLSLRDLKLNSGATWNANGGFGISIGGNAEFNGAVTSSGSMPGYYNISVSGTATVGGTLTVGGVNFSDNYSLPASTSFTPASEVRYVRSTAQTISSSFTFGNILLGGSGDKTLSAPLTLQQQLTLAGSARLVNSSFPVACGQALVNNSTALHEFGNATYAFTNAIIGGTGNTLMTNASITVTGATCVIGDGTRGDGNISIHNLTCSNTSAILTIAENDYSDSIAFLGKVYLPGINSSVIVKGGVVQFDSLVTEGAFSSIVFTNGDGHHLTGSLLKCGGELTVNTPVSATEDVEIEGDLNITNEFDVGGTLTVGGALTISGSGVGETNTFGGAVTVSGHTLVISGGVNEFNAGLFHNTSDAVSNCTLGGTITMGTSTNVTVHAVNVILAGVLLFDALAVTNPAGTLEANSDLIVRRTVGLAKDLDISDHTLYFLPSAPMNAITGSGEVVGTVRRTLENLGAYRFNSERTTVSVQGLSTAEEYEVTLVRNLADMQAVMRYYDIRRVGSDLTPAAGTYALGLPYAESELNGNDEATLKLAYGAYGSATENQFTKLPGSTVNTMSNIVTYSFDGLTSFMHRYTFGDLNAVLPVELRSFHARRKGTWVELRWNTASEMQNFGFEIERADDPGHAFHPIGFVPGEGTKSSPTDYQFLDRMAGNRAMWYRLRQIDRDGSVDVSPVIEVSPMAGDGAEITEYHIANHPNPFVRVTTVTFTAPRDGFASLRVTDALGRTVALEQRHAVRAHEQVALPIDLGDLPAGVYFCTVRCGDVVMLQRLALRR